LYIYLPDVKNIEDKMNIQDGMNIVDVLAIMPYYVSLFLITDDLSPGKKEEGGGMHMQIMNPWLQTL
jgi:hypothetical protein